MPFCLLLLSVTQFILLFYFFLLPKFWETVCCFISVFPGRQSGDELLNTPIGSDDLGWYDNNPATLTVTWNPKLLTNNTDDKVDISIIGYKEEGGKVRI